MKLERCHLALPEGAAFACIRSIQSTNSENWPGIGILASRFAYCKVSRNLFSFANCAGPFHFTA